MLQHGGCGEAVNTPGCEPGTRGFKSHQSPHLKDMRIIHCIVRFFFIFECFCYCLKSFISYTKQSVIKDSSILICHTLLMLVSS